MILRNETHCVELNIDKDWKWRTEDRARYDIVHDLPAGNIADNRDFCSTLSIIIGNHLRVAITGCFCFFSLNQHSAILEGDILTLLLNREAVQISLKDGQMLHCIDLNDDLFTGDCFRIFATPYGFIVHGEMNIIMLTRELKVLWTFSGSDIFVLPDEHKSALTLKEKTVELYDWLGNYYEVSLATGNQIRFIRAASSEA